jgi:hypothetical protein
MDSPAVSKLKATCRGLREVAWDSELDLAPVWLRSPAYAMGVLIRMAIRITEIGMPMLAGVRLVALERGIGMTLVQVEQRAWGRVNFRLLDFRW